MNEIDSIIADKIVKILLAVSIVNVVLVTMVMASHVSTLMSVDSHTPPPQVMSHPRKRSLIAKNLSYVLKMQDAKILLVVIHVHVLMGGKVMVLNVVMSMNVLI